ncbi:hypothetical protein HS088_TW22G00065 [Tripterygium wilfordii]|uniref:CAAX prenyl protease 2/Lysostaphin resistance protein A-like domain-containing protein n=1 Tax=Tripterygium wilfordii TaxID=458696 RepID=A0A7J7BXP2_TRIWF|nr:uncharacterized protein LOC119992191 [Tripterygium wilfordii]KAF5726387.1 hypothetical protein HS088_TW22G00065 [Tripterygium wilfordii]
MISPLWATVSPIRRQAAKLISDYNQPLLPSSFGLGLSLPKSSFRASFECRCTNKEIQDKPAEGFSVLASDIPWDTGSIWSTMAIYMFNLHIPLGYGGLSIVTYILHQSILKPETEALSLLILQILELAGAPFLLGAAKPNCAFVSFNANKSAKERNWLLASALGFGSIISLVFLTSILSDNIVGTKAVNNPVVKEILMSSLTSRTACVLVYCFIAPVLEETVYRWFLLTSLASTMDWRHAVLISSAIFSASHFSGENFLPLFIIGCVLGCSYSWTGKLRTPVLIHSLYNAFALLMTFLS